MNYTVITTKGRVFTFFIKEVAETYQQAYGGVIIDSTILLEKSSEPELVCG